MKVKVDPIPSKKQHWEKDVKAPLGKQTRSGIRAFDPMKAKDRPHTHVKVNETDH